jgi:hypothetical protein
VERVRFQFVSHDPQETDPGRLGDALAVGK